MAKNVFIFYIPFWQYICTESEFINLVFESIGMVKVCLIIKLMKVLIFLVKTCSKFCVTHHSEVHRKKVRNIVDNTVDNDHDDKDWWAGLSIVWFPKKLILHCASVATRNGKKRLVLSISVYTYALTALLTGLSWGTENWVQNFLKNWVMATNFEWIRLITIQDFLDFFTFKSFIESCRKRFEKKLWKILRLLVYNT